MTIAIENERTDREFVCHRAIALQTASIIEVDILAGLLADQPTAGGRSRRTRQAIEAEVATTMIENSNNDSGSDLWEVVGGARGVGAFNPASGWITPTSTRGSSGVSRPRPPPTRSPCSAR